MEEYFRTNFTKCNQNVSYLASKEFLEVSCHTGSVFMLIISSYVLFLMIRKSPSSMRSFVPYMVNLHIWTMICDFVFAVMFLPYFMIPMIGGNGLGVFLWFDFGPRLQIYLALAALAGMCAAVIILFEQRHRSIVTKSIFVIRNKNLRVLEVVFFYIFAINSGILIALTVPEDQEMAKLMQLKKLPCPPPLFFHKDTYILQNDTTIWSPMMYLSCLGLAVVVGFLNVNTSRHLSLKNNPSMSPSTRKLQRKYQIATIIQVSIPFFIVLVPNVYWNISITFRFQFQELNNLSVFCFTLHGISASISIIFLYAPYRKFTGDLLLYTLLRRSKVPKTTVTSVVSGLESSLNRTVSMNGASQRSSIR